MDEEKRQLIARVSFLLILAALFIMMFIWATVLDFGFVRLNGDAPFEVAVWGEETVICDISPCKIKQKTGEKSMVITKEGMQPIYKKNDLGRWRTQDIDLEFSYVPELKEVAEIPETLDSAGHEIVFDDGNRMYKLIAKDDPLETAIVYFPKKIEGGKVFSSEDSALVLGKDSAHKVDFIKKERVQINEKSFGGIISGQWSPNGQYFAYTVDWSDEVLLLDGTTVKRLTLFADSQFAWTYDNQLLFGVSQQHSETGLLFEIELLPHVSSEGLTFGLYDPIAERYRKIETFSEIEELPKRLIPVSSGQTIYVETAEKSYKIDF